MVATKEATVTRRINDAVSAMTDAEIAAEIVRLTGEMRALSGRHVPSRLHRNAPQWDALDKRRRHLKMERARRAEAALRTMSDAEVAAAARIHHPGDPTDHLNVLAGREQGRRRSAAIDRVKGRFEQMTFEELMQFAADSGGATEPEMRAAITVMWERRKQLNAAEETLTSAATARYQQDEQAREPERIALPAAQRSEEENQ
jgi:hypothetical protein